MAGDHRRVHISSTSEAMSSCHTWSTNGSSRSVAARPRSQETITFLRSHRSTSTPATGPRKKPGTMRAAITRPTAVSGDPPPTRVASAAMARKPIQSPIDETTCAHHSRKNIGDAKNRVRHSCLSSGARLDSSSGARWRSLLAPASPIRLSTSVCCSAWRTPQRPGTVRRQLHAETLGDAPSRAGRSGLLGGGLLGRGLLLGRLLLASPSWPPTSSSWPAHGRARSCSSSAARSMVMVSTLSSRRSDALSRRR